MSRNCTKRITYVLKYQINYNKDRCLGLESIGAIWSNLESTFHICQCHQIVLFFLYKWLSALWLIELTDWWLLTVKNLRWHWIYHIQFMVKQSFCWLLTMKNFHWHWIYPIQFMVKQGFWWLLTMKNLHRHWKFPNKAKAYQYISRFFMVIDLEKPWKAMNILPINFYGWPWKTMIGQVPITAASSFAFVRRQSSLPDECRTRPVVMIDQNQILNVHDRSSPISPGGRLFRQLLGLEVPL